ncbi:ABC-three component system middle component 6 [Stenotrophomonas maltophilia]|uniref:ABC-three component system middle component 6 n=1 Tax=Stenotrophomonas maltophilia TaxID=40324 RepID=UPI003D18954E
MSLKIQTALLPQKHIDFSRSIVGVAGLVRSILGEGPRSVDQLWHVAQAEDSGWPSRPSVELIILSVLLLFSIGEVVDAGDGRVGLSE